MARKPDPERIYLSRRCAHVRRLADGEHLGDETAERLVAGWEAEAAARGIGHLTESFWEDGRVWMAERRSKR